MRHLSPSILPLNLSEGVVAQTFVCFRVLAIMSLVQVRPYLTEIVGKKGIRTMISKSRSILHHRIQKQTIYGV